MTVFPPEPPPARPAPAFPKRENALVRTPPPAKTVSRAVPPAPSRRPRLLALAAVTGLGLAAAAYWAARRAPAGLEVPLGDASAVAVRPGSADFMVVQHGELEVRTEAGAVTERRPFPGTIESMRWIQGSLWTLDGTSAEVTERRPGERPTIFRLNHVPSALFVTGSSVWTVEKNGRTLHQYLLSRSILGAMLQPLDLLEIQNLTADTIAFDDSGTLWIADDRTRSLFRLRAQSGVYKIVDRAPLSPLLGPVGALRSLTVDGDSVWIFTRPAGGGNGTLRRIPISRLDWTRS